MLNSILILGASTRAATGSALRAGLNPATADLFADDDLQRMTDATIRIDDYPGDLPAIARQFPPGPWMFTGALENHPRIIDAIAAERPLWGTPSRCIARLRDPWQLARCLHDRDLLYPNVARLETFERQRDDAGRRWLKKPFRSAGGGQIQFWTTERDAASRRAGTRPSADASAAEVNANVDSVDGNHARYYLQQAVDGDSQSAVFVAAQGAACLLGVTQQLIGTSWTGATGFRYAGSIGPLHLDAMQQAAWCGIGDCLAREFQITGLFGVDAIVNERGIWTIEVNPRYTSSVEVLEFGLDRQAIAEHVAACRNGQLGEHGPRQGERHRGKAIIYASRDVWIGEPFVEAARGANEGHQWPELADIPTARQTIRDGHPVASVFVSCEQLDDVESHLRQVVHRWRAAWNL